MKSAVICVQGNSLIFPLVLITFGQFVLTYSRYTENGARFFKKFIYFIYLFLTALGLHCCTQAFSCCGEWGLLFVVVCGLLIVVASLVAEHGL